MFRVTWDEIDQHTWKRKSFCVECKTLSEANFIVDNFCRVSIPGITIDWKLWRGDRVLNKGRTL